jgi:hypothetical protein
MSRAKTTKAAKERSRMHLYRHIDELLRQNPDKPKRKLSPKKAWKKFVNGELKGEPNE